MNIENMTLKEVETRLAAIAQEVNADGADLDALEAETRSLRDRRDALMQAAEKRNQILQTVSAMSGGTPVVPAAPETRSFDGMERSELIASPEYRSAWAKHILGRNMTDVEQRAFSTATGSGGAVVPTAIMDQVMEKARQRAPLLAEITLLHIPGNIKVPVEGTTTDAAEHPENSAVSDANDTIVEVFLGGFELVKKLPVSRALNDMSIPDFERFIIDKLLASLIDLMTRRILSGTGSNQATGVEKANTWGPENSITVANGSNLTAANVLALIGLLPGGYDYNAKFTMSKKTLFTDFLPLQDKSKNDLVTIQNGTYYVQGYPVMLDDYVPLHEAYLGDFSKYIGNISAEPVVTKTYDPDNNNYKYVVYCLFDGKPGIGEAFVKLVKAAE